MTDSHLELADYRRRVAAIYLTARDTSVAPAARAAAWRSARDDLYRAHPQSPIPAAARAAFGGLRYWPYAPALALRSRLDPDPDEPSVRVPRSDGGTSELRRIGSVSFEVDGQACRLGVYWFTDYAGGIFIPFRDATNGTQTYGGGRYLWDSAKGADLGSADDDLVLDFNLAYHPSCTYDDRWSCPLAPPENWLAVPIRAGERLSDD